MPPSQIETRSEGWPWGSRNIFIQTWWIQNMTTVRWLVNTHSVLSQFALISQPIPIHTQCSSSERWLEAYWRSWQKMVTVNPEKKNVQQPCFGLFVWIRRKPDRMPLVPPQAFPWGHSVSIWLQRWNFIHQSTLLQLRSTDQKHIISASTSSPFRSRRIWCSNRAHGIRQIGMARASSPHQTTRASTLRLVIISV